jgi:hypothetical protein
LRRSRPFERPTKAENSTSEWFAVVCSDGLTLEPSLDPPPGFERVLGLGNDISEPIV